MNQLHASGRKLLKINLKKSLNKKIKEIEENNELSEVEKKQKILIIKTSYRKKEIESKHYYF